MNVIFMGTSDFGAPSLKAIIDNPKFKIEAVFSQRPKPKNRGLKLLEKSPIHKIADENNLKIYTPKTLKSEESYKIINEIKADIIVVCAYGLILPKNILNNKKYGCINIHPSLLPKYRGAAPLQRTIINGDTKTAICIIQMDEGIDTGHILCKENLTINHQTNIKELHDKTSIIGAKLVQKALIEINTLKKIPQSTKNASYAQKLTKEEAKVNFKKETAFEIDCKIRGMLLWPCAFFIYNNINIKILNAFFIDIEHNFISGEVININSLDKKILNSYISKYNILEKNINNNLLSIACKKGVINILTIQKPGKKPMDIKSFLNGNPIKIGTILN